MKRYGFVLLGLSLIVSSGDSSLDFQGAYAGPSPQPPAQQRENDEVPKPQMGAIAENAAIGNNAVSAPVFNKVFRIVHADVVAIDQPYVINRMGASQPEGMIFVLKEDLVRKTGSGVAMHDNFKLREGKRPRPLVLRMNVGD